MSKIEKNKKVQALANSLRNKFNVYFTSKSLGSLEFRQFSFREFSKINTLLKDTSDEREFAINLVYSIILEPKFSQADFHNISDSELISIIRQICDKNENLKKFFNTPTDNRVFIEFKKAVTKYNDEKVADFTKLIQSVTPPHVIIPRINAIQSWVHLNPTLFHNISWQIKELSKSLLKYHTTIESANKILKKYKWFVSLSLPDTFYGAVLDIEKSGAHKRKRINRLFIDYFLADGFQALEEMVEDWKDNPHFKPRMKIFRNCIKTLKRAKRDENPSILIIPALIAQIDGIINEIVNKYNVKKDPLTKMWIDGKGNQSKTKKEAIQKLIASLNEYSPLGEFLLLEILFQQSIPELSIQTTFSRHKIIHGEFLNYGRVDNTIKAFLILDFLHYLP